MLSGTSGASDGSGEDKVAERLAQIEAMQAQSDTRLDRIESMLSSMHHVVMRGGGGGGVGAKAAPSERRWEEGNRDKKEDADVCGHEGKPLVVPTVADVVVLPRAPRLDS